MIFLTNDLVILYPVPKTGCHGLQIRHLVLITEIHDHGILYTVPYRGCHCLRRVQMKSVGHLNSVRRFRMISCGGPARRRKLLGNYVNLLSSIQITHQWGIYICSLPSALAVFIILLADFGHKVINFSANNSHFYLLS